MIYSIIDIGSNSVRMSVYRINNDNSFTRLFSEKEMAGLINYIVDNNMTEEGIDKICEILEQADRCGHGKVRKLHPGHLRRG